MREVKYLAGVNKMKLKPAYKMKKSEIIKELNEVYGVVIEGKVYKRDLVFKLQSCRMDGCTDCSCKDMDDKSALREFFNMFKFWN